MSEINLLPKSHGFSLQQEKSIAMFRRVSIVVLTVTAFLSIVIFILVISSPLAKSQDEEQSLIATMSKFSNKISRHTIMQERLTAISTILKSRSTYEKDIANMTDNIPEKMKVSSLEVASKSIQFAADTPSLDDANAYIDRIKKLKDENSDVTAVVLKSFILQGNTGRYYFTLQIALK